MQLNISFSDGTKKIINLTPNFFMEKTTTEINKKAKELAFSDHVPPYKYELTRGNRIIFERTHEEFAPVVEKEIISMTQKDRKKWNDQLKEVKKSSTFKNIIMFSGSKRINQFGKTFMS